MSDLLLEKENENKNVVYLIMQSINRSGLWVSGTRKMCWLVRSACMTFLITLLTQVIALYLARGDSKRLFECFSVLTFSSMGGLKIKSLYSNKDRWQQLLLLADNMEIEQLKTDTLDVEYESDDENSNQCFAIHIQKYTIQFRALATTLTRMYIFILIVFALTPFIEWGYWKINEVEMEVYPHILPGWAPLDTFGFYGWMVTILAEIVAAIYCVFVQIAFDLTAFGLMIFISGQFSLLCKYIELIGGKGKNNKLSQKRDVRAHYRIIKCHGALIKLDSSITLLENLTRDILGIYYLIAIWTLCSVALRLSAEEMSRMQVVNLLQYTGGVLTQLFLFCYYGDKILHKSSVGMAEGPFAAAYWCLSPWVRRELLLLAVGMTRVRRLRAGPFNSLDLPSFIQIVRAAYSYFAVLRK